MMVPFDSQLDMSWLNYMINHLSIQYSFLYSQLDTSFVKESRISPAHQHNYRSEIIYLPIYTTTNKG